MTNKRQSNYQYRNSAIFLVLAGLSLYVLLPQLQSFKHSFQTLLTSDLTWLLISLLTFILTYFFAALTLCLLAYFKLKYWPTLLIQIADGFTNKLVPAGIGAVTTNFLYLKRQSNSDIKAGYVAVINNIIGFVAHILLFLVLVALSKQSLGRLVHVRQPHIRIISITALIIIILTALLFSRQIVRFFSKNFNQFKKVLLNSFKRPKRLFFSLLSSFAITILYALTLYAVMQALNVHISVLQTFIAFTISVFVSIITPTPGGIGGVEASLVASLIAFGVSPQQALSVTLTFRFITYWLPIVPGIAALETANKKGYLIKN